MEGKLMRCSTLLAIGEMQIKATVRNPYTPIRAADTPNTTCAHTQYQTLVRTPEESAGETI